MVKVRRRNSNGKTVKQTVKNGRKSPVTTPRGRHESWCQAAAVRGSVPILINPELLPNLMPRSTVTRVWLTEWAHLGQLCACGTLTSDIESLSSFFFFFFFFLSFRECCLTTEWQWQSTECDARYMVQRKKFDVILRLLVDRYRRTKPPKPDGSQFVVPARLPKPVIGSGGLSSSRGSTTMCQKSTAHEQRRSRGESRKLRFGSNRMAPKIWQEGQHDLHSPPQPIDWREHTIGAVHDRNLPTRSLQVPESYENFLWHLVKVRRIVTGLRHDDERDDDRSHRRVSIMSSLDAGWFRLITNILIQSRDLAMIARWHGTSVAPWRHKSSHVPVFRRLFDRLPVRISTSDLHHRILRQKLYHIRAYDFGVQFSFNAAAFELVGLRP